MKQLLQKIAIAILSVFVVVYFVVQLVASYSDDIVYNQAVMASYREYDEVTGYILRDESVVTNDLNGIVYTPLEEGAKVRRGELIATVYANASEKNIQDRILEIDDRIEILTDSQIDTSYITSDVSNLDSNIYDLIYKIRADVEDNSPGSAVKNKKELLTFLNRRQILIKKIADFSEEIDKLQSEKHYLESSLNGELGKVYSDKAGYFSLDIDGWETILTPSALEGLTVNGFKELLNRDPEEYPNAVGKIFTDFKWYTLCPVDKSLSMDYTVGSYYSLEFYMTTSHVFRVKLENVISQTDSDTVLLVFSTDDIPDGFRYSRKQSVRIVKNSLEGLRVNKEALRMIDGKQGVYVVLGNTVRFRTTQIIYSSDDYYLVKQFKPGEEGYSGSLMLYDKIIIGGKNLYDGKIVD